MLCLDIEIQKSVFFLLLPSLDPVSVIPESINSMTANSGFVIFEIVNAETIFSGFMDFFHAPSEPRNIIIHTADAGSKSASSKTVSVV